MGSQKREDEARTRTWDIDRLGMGRVVNLRRYTMVIRVTLSPRFPSFCYTPLVDPLVPLDERERENRERPRMLSGSFGLENISRIRRRLICLGKLLLPI